MTPDNRILIGKKNKEDGFSFHWEIIEQWWVENGELKIWKRLPPRYAGALFSKQFQCN